MGGDMQQQSVTRIIANDFTIVSDDGEAKDTSLVTSLVLKKAPRALEPVETSLTKVTKEHSPTPRKVDHRQCCSHEDASRT